MEAPFVRSERGSAMEGEVTIWTLDGRLDGQMLNFHVLLHIVFLLAGVPAAPTHKHNMALGFDPLLHIFGHNV